MRFKTENLAIKIIILTIGISAMIVVPVVLSAKLVDFLHNPNVIASIEWKSEKVLKVSGHFIKWHFVKLFIVE